MTWTTITELKAATRAAKQRLPGRGDYFGPAETRFFDSIVEPMLYGGRYFVESVKPPDFFGEEQPRVWHVVRATQSCDAPSFDTLGPWGTRGYATPEEARTVAAELAELETAGRLIE